MRGKLLNASLISAVLIMALPSFFLAQCPNHKTDTGGPGMGESGGGMMVELTADQKVQMMKLKMSFMKETEPLKTELEIKQMELNALWDDEKPDAGKLKAKVKEIGELKMQLQEKMINHKLAVMKLFTPEQMKKMKSMMGMGCGMMGGCKAKGGDSGPGK